MNEKECYTITYTVQKLHSYVLRSQLTVRTESKGLINSLNSKHKNRKIHNWSQFIQSCLKDIQYIPGSKNIADKLSRPTTAAKQQDTYEDDILPDV